MNTVGIRLVSECLALSRRSGVARAAPNLSRSRDSPCRRTARQATRVRSCSSTAMPRAAAAEWKLVHVGVDDVVMVSLGSGDRWWRDRRRPSDPWCQRIHRRDRPWLSTPTARRLPVRSPRLLGATRRVLASHVSRNVQMVAGALRAITELAAAMPMHVLGEHVTGAARRATLPSAVVDNYGRWVALGLVNLTNVLDPAMFVLGGGLAVGADVFLAPIRHWFGELLYAPDLRPHPALDFA